MMKKSAIILGIFSVLLMSFGMVNASVADFDLYINGAGNSSANPIVGDNSSSPLFDVVLSNTNSSINPAYVKWRVAISNDYTNVAGDGSYVTNLTDNYTVSGFSFDMQYNAPTHFIVYADVYSDVSHNNLVGTEQINVYYNNTDYVEPVVQGCIDPSAENYNPSATADDGSCTYPSPEETACEFEFNESENGTLKIAGFDLSSTGDKEEWAPLDELSIEVEIENKDKHDDVRDVEVRMIVLNDTGYDVTDDFDFDDDVITSINRLNNDDSEYVTFDIKVPADVEYGEYKLYVVAYSDGKIDEQCVSKYNDNDFTDDLYYSFSVEEVEYEDSIIVDENDLGTVMEVYCGQSSVEVAIPVYNLNDDDEPMILVELYNSELGISEKKTIKDLNDRDDETLVFYIDVPKDLEKDRYDLRIKAYFDWDDNEDESEFYAYNEENTYYLSLDVTGCSGPAPSIKPSLESEIKEGSELVVSALITNNGKDASFDVSVSGYESWADLISITPQNAVVAEGEFVEATIVLMPKSDGRKSFTVSATVDGETYNQPISVEVKNSLGLNDLLENNIYLALAIAIVVVLIFIILTLIVKTSKRRPVKPQF